MLRSFQFYFASFYTFSCIRKWEYHYRSLVIEFLSPDLSLGWNVSEKIKQWLYLDQVTRCKIINYCELQIYLLIWLRLQLHEVEYFPAKSFCQEREEFSPNETGEKNHLNTVESHFQLILARGWRKHFREISSYCPHFNDVLNHSVWSCGFCRNNGFYFSLSLSLLTQEQDFKILLSCIYFQWVWLS